LLKTQDSHLARLTLGLSLAPGPRVLRS
jgi:hypothetical protein